VEALLLSMALANRINIYKEEKRKAQQAVLRSLEKNKKLVVEQNMFLEKKVAERTTELKKANDELVLAMQNPKEAQSQLVQREKMASLGEMTAGIAHEIQNPLNFVNNFSEVSSELVDELKAELASGTSDVATAIASDLKQNLQKILFHGKRADSIVRGMLEHSRLRRGKREEVALNDIVDESLRLSYHAVRATDKSFKAIIETHFDENIGTVEVVAQDMGRVLINIFNNAFYSLREKQKGVPADYRPVLSVSTRLENQKAVVSIRDNGIGISPKVQAKIYQPFFTTKPAGEGTGLGLSLSYDIVTKEHDGALLLNTQEGEYAEFVIELPLGKSG
jgi:signal transduction histidine kinase